MKPYYQDEGIYLGDCRELAASVIPDNSADLIFTDPPYIKKYIPLYSWLAKEANRSLKDNGFLLTYVGTYWKDDVMALIRPHMEYYFDFILENGQNSPIMWTRKVISRHKSIIAYRKKGSSAHPKTNVLSLMRGGGKDKRFHKWGQDMNSARYYLDVFSREGDLVVDYFFGGGTTAEICKRLNRRFVGFEIDEETYNIARARVNGGLGPAEKGRQSELVLK